MRKLTDSEFRSICKAPKNLLQYVVDCPTVCDLRANIFKWFKSVTGRDFSNQKAEEGKKIRPDK